MKTLSFQLTIPRFILWAAVVFLALPARAQVPVITSEPTNVTAPLGSTVSFTVVATGATTYKWHKLSAGSATIGTQATLTLANIADSDADTYTVVVGNISGSVTSSPAVLTVTHPPVITSQPSGLVVNTGDEADFDVNANGATPFSYQWQSNGIALASETDSSLSLNPTLDSFAAAYSVVITNSDGSSNSANALLSVVEPALIATPSLAANSCSNVALSVVVYGSDPSLQYQWYFGTNMTPVGTNGPILSLTNISFANAGVYSVTVSNPAGFGSSATATNTLTVQDPPPVVLTRNITVQLDASGNVSITPSQVDNGSYDNCAITNESVSPNTFTCLNVGTNTVTLYVTDNSNQLSSATALVTVQDVTPPTPVFNTISVQLDGTGNYTLTSADDNAITAGSSDNCGIASTNITPSSFTFCDVGAKSVTLTLTDVHGNTITTNGVINVLAPVAAPAVVYVDASYSGCGPVTFPNAGGTGSHFIGYDAFATVQGGVNAVAPGGIVNVAAGTYNESVNASKSVTLLGANQGAAGCGSRGAESIINGGAGNAITVAAANVVINGFDLTGAQGVQAVGYAAVICDNVIGAAAAGVNVEGITTTTTNLVVENNCITLSTQVNGGSTPTFGVLLVGVSGTQSPIIQGNGIQGAFYGYMLYGLNAGVPTVVRGGTVTGAMQGVAVLNLNPVTLSSYGPSTFTLDGVSLSGFTGNWPSLPNNNIHAGVYIYTGGSGPSAEVVGTITNVTITGTDNLSPDSAGLDFADFSTGAGVRQQITVQNSVISTNSNRGIFVSGTNAVANVSGSSIVGNGFNPYGTGGNPGFGVIARNNSQVTVSQCFIANPAAQTAYSVTAVEADANTAPLGPTLIVTDCSIVNNGNGNLAGQDAGTLNASGNWWGSTSDTTIASLMTGVVDFTPYLDSGTDTDNVTPGFQGDFSTLHVTTLGAQTAGQRVQEGHDLATGASPTVIVQAGSYGESVAISKSGFTLKSAQNAGVDARGARNAESIMSSTALGGIIQISANNVTIDGMQTAGPGAVYGVNVSASAANAAVINTIMSGGGVGAGVFGTATLRYDVASVPANTVGILASGSSAAALVEYNSLTGDTEAGIKATLGAIVDAGDCAGGNVTGLGTGSGLNGSSAGGNNLTGYGFDNTAPWAIENLNPGGTPAVLAYQDNYGAVAGNLLASLFTGSVLADQAGALLLVSPTNLAFQCLSSVPSGAADLPGFMAQGGVASTTAATVSFNDSVVSNNPNNLVITRTYTVTDACNQASCVQTITVDDTIPPTVVTKAVTITLDSTGNGSITLADVFNATLSSDNCSTVTPVSVSRSTFTFCDVGTTDVIVTAMDSSGNIGSNTAAVTIKPPVGSPAVVYVDTNYTGGCAAPFPFIGGSGAYFVGYNAFPTIQAGLNAVAAKGTVNVAPETYNENPVLNQSVTLTSVGGNSASNTFIVLQPTNFYNGLTVNASCVAVKGFTIVGYDATSTNTGPTEGTAIVDITVNDASPNPSFTNIEIANNVIEVGAVSTLGFYTYSDGFGIETTIPSLLENGPESQGEWAPGTSPAVSLVNNLNVHNNVFQLVDVPPAYDTSGDAFFINPAGNFTFVSNTITGDFGNSTTSATNSYIAYNVIIGTSTNDSSGGIATLGWPDPAFYGQGTIIDNVITNIATAIFVYDSENVTIASNLLNGDGVGISVQDSGYDPVYPAGNTVQILDNSLANDAAGIVNTSSNSTPVAVSNWWGDISGPSSVALNYYGTGSSVSSNLTFVPWLNSGGNTVTNGFSPASPAPAYPPVQLVFTTQPGGADLGSPLSAQPVVQLEDTNGNVTPWANPIVTNILGNDLTGAILLGITNEPAAAGVATFTDLYVTIAGGSNLTLVASAPALPAATSSAFNITNPVPTISSVNPFFARAGGSNFTLTVSGSGFVGDSVVYWNGIALMTTYVSSTELTAIVPGSDIASVGPNTVTVGSPGPGGGATAPVNFSVDVASPPIVYVDHNYAGVATNTLVDWPYDTNSGPHIIGYDAFATVQGGVNGVAVSGTVNVAAGRYVEEVTIGQPLTLLGPNATNNPNICTRVAEAVIQPDYNDPEIYDANAVEIVSLESSNITVKGFTIDGYNPDLSGAFTSGTNFFNAAIGIGDYNGDSSIRIENNIVKNDSYVGVDLESDGPESPPNTNSCIKGNLIENMDYNTEGFGFGIILAQNYYAEIADNSLQNVAIGISPQNFNLANPGDVKGQTIRSNNVSASLLGIWLNLVYSSASTFNISDNTSSYAPTNGSVLYGPPGPPEWDAIEITSIQSAASVVASNNVITGPGANVGYNTVGYNIWNTPTTGSVAIIGGSVSNANYGVWVNNYDGYQSRGGSTTVTVNGVNISGATLAGVYVQDDPRASTNGVLVRATVNGNTVISNSTLGVLVQGTNAGASVLNNSASITGNGVGVAVDTGVALLQNNDLTGNSVAGISATNGAIVDAGNCTGSSITRLGISTGGNNLSYGFGGTAPWAILNVSGCKILAEQDNFGATMPTNIAAAFNDPGTVIVYSQLPAVIAAPAGQSVTCDGSVLPPVNSLSGFIGQGGYVSVGPASYWQSNLTVTPSDTVYPVVGNGTDIRTYTIVDSCNTYTVAQTNTVLNTNLPVFTFTPPNVVQGTVSPSCTATVSITPATATGYCDGADHQPTVTVTAARSDLDPNVNDPYPIGLTTIIWTARDIYGNQNTYTQTVTVQDTTPPVVGTWPANQNLYVGGTCEAAVPDLSSQVRVTSSCNGVNITQIPPANTMVSVGITNVTVVVTAADNPTNSVSNTVVLTVIDTNPPTATYVDTGYTGLASGTIVTWPAVGGNGTHYIGCDAFPTIQAGINRVATNGTVNVAAGRYVGEVTISQPLTLLGPNATNNPNTSPRVAEAVIQPDTSDPEMFDYVNGTSPLYYNSAAVVVVSVASSNVTIKGLTIDGYNPDLSGAFNSGTNYFDAAVGIGDYNGDNSVKIENNIVKNDSFAGVDLESDATGVPTTNSCIRGNLIENINYNTEGYGEGIYLQQNYYAEVSGNTLLNVAIGISPQWFYSANPGDVKGQIICSNTVNASLFGIWVNLVYSSGSTFIISENTSAFAPTNGSALYAPPEWDGIVISSIQDDVGIVATNNTIIGTQAPVGGYNAVGYNIWNTPTTAAVAISGGSVSNANYGVWLNNYDLFGPGGSTRATVNNVNISGASLAGVYVQDDPRASANGVLVQATITSNTVISSCALGVWVQGTNAGATVINNNASITGNGVGVTVDTGVALLQNNDLTGNTVAGISATNGAIVDAGNCTGTNVTGLGISTGGNNLSYGFAGSPWAIINGNTGGSPIVLADHDNFGAVVGNNIPGAFSGNVEYSQSPAVIAAPTDLSFTCPSSVPAGVTSLSNYVALGGYYSASMASVSSVDVTNLSPSDYTNYLGSGVIQRTYTLTDGCGVSSMAVQTITVSDTMPPFFTVVPPNVTYPADLGQCSKANVMWVITAGDNCGVASVVSTPPSGSTFAKGPTTVTTIATDYSGNTATNIFTVTVTDTQAPIITQCAPANTNIDANTNAQACLPNLRSEVRATDNCDIPVITQIPAAGTVVGLGVHTVTLWASDTSGNSNSCAVTVTVLDVTPPTITCPADVTVTVLQDKDPYATGTATATDAGASQEDLPVTITYTDNPNGLTNCDATGTILRTWYAVDPSNNTNYCTQTITVIDDIAPFFTYVPTNITTTNDPGNCSAAVNYPTPKATDLGYAQGFENTNWVSCTNGQSLDWNDYFSHVERVPSGTGGINASSGAAYALIDSTVPQAGPDYTSSGAYTFLGGINSAFGPLGYRVALDVYMNLKDPAVVNATLTNGYGWDLTTAGSQLNGSNLRDFIFHTAAYDSNGIVVAADNNSNDGPEPRYDGDLRTAFTNYAVITNSGWYTFEWEFRNTNGVLAVDLEVHDKNHTLVFSQTLSNPSDAITNVGGNPNYMWFTFLSVDTLPIDNTVFERNETVSSMLASGSVFPVGTTIVTNTTQDACGNATNSTFTVTVNDVEPPFIPVLSDVTQANDPGNCSAVVSYILPTNSITDNCGVSNIVGTPSSGSTFPVGTNLVFVVATDIHGNSTTNTFNVIVNDTEPPSANVPAGIVQANDPGNCSAVVYFTLPAQTDNCGVASTNATPPSGSAFPVGTDVVTVVVTDIHGNTATNTFTVTVNDTEPPVVNCPADIVQGVDFGQTYATVTFTPTASDNCGVSTIVAIPPSGSHFPIGTNTVSVLATDIHGNTSPCSFTVQVVGLPQITQQPVSRTNNAGTTATFTVVATSPTQLSYLWKKNGAALSDTGNISGSATATLTVTNVSDSDVASYSVCVSNLGGKVISSPATLTVIDPPVIVSITPMSQTNNASTTATFTVSATGTTPFTYQWTKITTNATNVLMDGGNILGSTSNVLTISNLLATDQAEYEVAVSNPAGSPTTNGTLFVIDPAILVQPVEVTTNQGGNATFTVIAAGTAPLSYQWQQDDVDLPGQTGSSLTVNDAQDSDEGGYTVVVSNSVGEITSASATLTLTHPPVIVTQPASRTNNLGTTATFTVSVDGATPFTYQWEKNGINISGATNITLVLSSVSSNDAANYQVAITNSNGYIISAAATLTVIVPPAITSQPVGLTNNAGTTASFSATASGTSPAYQWYEVTATATNALSDSNNISGSLSNVLTISNVLGADDASYYLLASNQAGVAVSSNAILAVIDPIITNEPANMTVNLGSPASFSVGAYGTSPQYQWYKNGTNIGGANASTYTIAAAADSDQASYTVIVTNIYGAVTSAPPATLTVIDPPVITGQPLSLTNNAGTTATFSVTATGTSPTYQWYYGLLPIGGANSATLILTNVQDGNAGSYSVVLSNAAGVMTSASATLTVIDAPAIMGQPVSQTNNAGTTAMFSVTATGTSPTYQWYYGLLPIGGANSATLILTNVQDGNAGSYSVVLSNAAGVATSTSATLTVIDAPVITGQPMSRTNNAGTTATFSVTATGTSPSYQWYQGATPIGGANSATLSLLNVQDTNAGSYSVVLSNAAGVVTSASATLTVIDAPLITGQPSSVTNNASTTATFSVTNTGTPPLVYQWYKITLTSTNALSDTNNISGSASNVLTIANVLAADEASYSVTITNAAGAAVSSNAVLVVIDPVILVQPVGSTNFDGSTVTFSVTAAGTATLSYQWYQDNVALYGDTNSSLTLANLADDDAGTYTVVVSNSVGSVISSPAVLLTIAPLITSQPSNVTVVQGGSANFSVSVDGETPFQYQWLFNGTNLSGATNRIFALSNVQTNNGGNYQVIVSDPIGVQTSLVATLTVVVPPAITAQPTNLIALAGQTASFNVIATGMPLVYQWYLNSTNLPFATNATLTLNDVTTNNSGTYFVTVTNLGGSVTSSNVTLAVYTTAAPELTLVLYTNSQATLELVGVPTYNYSIQSSSNFLEWAPLVTNASPFTFTDTNQAGHRFYRGRYVP